MTAISCYPLGFADATWLQDTEKACFGADKAWSLRDYCNLFKKSGAAVIFRFHRGSCEIVSLMMEPRWRGRCYARYLMGNVLMGLGSTPARLEVWTGNAAAIGLYEDLGFKKRRLLKNYYGRGRHAYTMEYKHPPKE